MTELEEYYNKFNEEKRLNSRHGRVEFITSLIFAHRLKYWMSVREQADIQCLLPRKAMM